MAKTYIMMQSVTHAMRGRDVLKKQGFKASVERTPRNYDPTGCGYSIVLRENGRQAEKFMRTTKLKVVGSHDEFE